MVSACLCECGSRYGPTWSQRVRGASSCLRVRNTRKKWHWRCVCLFHTAATGARSAIVGAFQFLLSIAHVLMTHYRVIIIEIVQLLRSVRLHRLQHVWRQPFIVHSFIWFRHAKPNESISTLFIWSLLYLATLCIFACVSDAFVDAPSPHTQVRVRNVCASTFTSDSSRMGQLACAIIS